MRQLKCWRNRPPQQMSLCGIFPRFLFQPWGTGETSPRPHNYLPDPAFKSITPVPRYLPQPMPFNSMRPVGTGKAVSCITLVYRYYGQVEHPNCHRKTMTVLETYTLILSWLKTYALILGEKPKPMPHAIGAVVCSLR